MWRRVQRYAPGMGYPRDQVTAPPDQWRGYRPGHRAEAPVKEPFDDEPAGFSTEEFDRIYSSYVPPMPTGRARHAGNESAGSGYMQAALNGRAPATPPAAPVREQQPGPRHGRHPANGQPPQDRSIQEERSVPQARRAPQDAVGYQPPPSAPGSHRAVPQPRSGRPGRGPANGFPPKPGEPGPQYPQPQFAAWNRSSAPADGAAPSEVSAAFTLASAPTWADIGERDSAPPSTGPGGGLALAERPDAPATFTDEDVDAWTASLDRVQTLVPGDRPPAFASDIDEDEPAGWSRHDSVARAAGLTRAATAKARKAARRRGRTRRRLMAGVCLPAVAVIAIMAYLQNSGGHKAKDTASSSPAATLAGSTPSPTLGTWQHIGTRAGDPTPLTLSQLFPAQFTVSGVSYVRTVQAGSTNCASAVFGKRLQAAVRKYGCTQIMRASYLDSQQKLMGTIGVVNLADSAGSDKVGEVTGSSQFIAQLTAASGPTHSLTKGTGLEEAEIKGHYLILTWVEYTTLKAPGTARQRAQLKAFSASLVSQTANVSLTSRMVTGQPQVP